MTTREKADRLRDEIALLAAVKEANETMGEAHAEYEFDRAVAAGISEWDADHPCRAIDEREAELRRVCPDLALREMGAPVLPGMEAFA